MTNDEMAPDYTAKTLSPIIPVADLQRSIRFYIEVLGFDTTVQSDSYSVLVRGGASLHLTRAENQSVLDATGGHMSIYLEVEEIESLWTHVSRFKDRYRIRDLFDREYGMREFHICDPDDCLIFVGQRIGTPAESACARNAPEPILRAGNETVSWACIFCRNHSLHAAASVEMINAAMEAIHEIPRMLVSWDQHDLAEIRTHLGCFPVSQWPGAPDLVAYFNRKLIEFGYKETVP
jgi:catechol 2,3-dioxygenase-like lactoylglutathione lyase family enzyme